MKATRFALLMFFAANLHAHETGATAHYLANEAVVITRGDTQIAFDPLYRNTHRWESVPADIERALVSGEPPFDSIDAVFISHNHEDHFDPALLLDWLEASEQIELYAPAQAVQQMLDVRQPAKAVMERIHAITMQPGDPAQTISHGDLVIEVVRIPHSGWPTQMTDVENLSYRVTMDDATTVVHMGDADTSETHYFQNFEHWEAAEPDLAMPPYWFFDSEDGRLVLEDYVRAKQNIGIHVPADMPDEPVERPEPYGDADLFTRPGETREIP